MRNNVVIYQHMAESRPSPVKSAQPVSKSRYRYLRYWPLYMKAVMWAMMSGGFGSSVATPTSYACQSTQALGLGVS